MGIDPIGYKPWVGQRTSGDRRTWVIARTLFMNKVRSKGILVLLILGYIGVWVFPIILYSILPHTELEAATMSGQMGNGALFIFSLLLASLVCSDVISEDLRSNSFVLYFSRAVKADNYLLGKIIGVVLVMALFCFIPPLIMGLALIGTQSGSAYISGLAVLVVTVGAGGLATVFLIPFSIFVSSLTTRKSFAAIGTFMVIVVLSIIGEIFSQFNANWNLVNPGMMLAYIYDWIYGRGIPDGIDGGLLVAISALFTVVPLALVYLKIHLKAEGK